MKTITVAELRQNPTAALADVEAGETYVVTKHQRPIARLVPPLDNDSNPALQQVVPPRRTAPTNLALRTPWTLKTAATVDELLDDMQSDW